MQRGENREIEKKRFRTRKFNEKSILAKRMWSLLAECSKVRYPLLRTINSELRQATLDAGVLSTPAPEPTPTGGATAATAAGVGVATLLSLAAAVLLH